MLEYLIRVEWLSGRHERAVWFENDEVSHLIGSYFVEPAGECRTCGTPGKGNPQIYRLDRDGFKRGYFSEQEALIATLSSNGLPL